MSNENKEITLQERLESEFKGDGFKKLKNRWSKIAEVIGAEEKLDKSVLFEVDAASLISGLNWKIAFEEKLVHGSNDGGIDAIHITENTIFLIQTKFKSSLHDGKGFHKAPILKMIDTYENYFKKSQALPDSYKSLKPFIEKFKKSTATNVEFIFICLESKEKDSLEESFNKPNITMMSYKDLLLNMASHEWTSESTKEDFILRLPFRVKDHMEKEIDENWYGMVNGDEFIKQFTILSDFGIDALFEKNIRNSVVPKTFKDELHQTIINTPKYFQLFNNGITMVARVIKKHNNDHELKVIAPQIVNGQQTLRTLISLYKEGCDLSEIKIPIKALQVSDEELITKIARYSNNQTAVKQADLKVTHPGYKKIIQAAKSIGYHVDGKKGKNLSDEIIMSLVKDKKLQVNELIRSHSASFYPKDYLGKSKVAISNVVTEYFGDSDNKIDKMVEKKTFQKIVDSIREYETHFNETEKHAKDYLKSQKRTDIQTWRKNLADQINHLKFGISVFYYIQNEKSSYDAGVVVKDIYENEAGRTINIFKSNDQINAAVQASLKRLKNN